MGRAYNPTRIIKSSGVHTFYTGKPEDPLSQVIETYCIHTEQTFSETCRDMLVIAAVYLGYFEDPGIDDGTLLDVGGGVLTPKFYEFRKQAEQKRKQQLKRLAKKSAELKTKKNQETNDTAFD